VPGGGGGGAAAVAAAAAAGGEGDEDAAPARPSRETLHARIPQPLVFDYVQRYEGAEVVAVVKPLPSSGTLAVSKILRAGKKKA
jgi:hypothetical protein